MSTTITIVDNGPTLTLADETVTVTIAEGGPGIATRISYTPTTGADWTDPDPTTVQGALDALAGNGGGGSGTSPFVTVGLTTGDFKVSSYASGEAAVQAAIDSLTNGGLVYLLDKITCTSAGVVLGTYVDFWGELEWADGATFTDTTPNANYLLTTGAGSRVPYVRLWGNSTWTCPINGTDTYTAAGTNTLGGGLLVAHQRAQIGDAHIEGMAEHGYVNTRDGGSASDSAHGVKVAKLYVVGCGGTGVYVHAWAYDGAYGQVEVGRCGHGVAVLSGDTHIDMLHPWGNQGTGVILDSGSDVSRIGSLYTETNGGYGLILNDTNGCAVDMLDCWNNGRDGTHGGIKLQDASYNTFSQVHIRDNVGISVVTLGVSHDNVWGDGSIIDAFAFTTDEASVTITGSIGATSDTFTAASGTPFTSSHLHCWLVIPGAGAAGATMTNGRIIAVLSGGAAVQLDNTATTTATSVAAVIHAVHDGIWEATNSTTLDTSAVKNTYRNIAVRQWLSTQVFVNPSSRAVDCPGVNARGSIAFASTGASLSIDAKVADHYDLTLTQNATSFSFLGPSPAIRGTRVTVIFRQDSTGSRTVTGLASSVKAIGGALNLSTTASAVDVSVFESDGTDWYETSRRRSDASAARTALGLGTAATSASTAFDAAGTAAALVDDLSGVTDAATARTNLGVQRSYRIDVRDYGATGDGTTDDSAAIQSAINAAVNATFSGIGTEVFFPTGKYYVATGLTCSGAAQGVAFVGQGSPGTSDDLASGSTQIIVGDGQWGLTLGSAASGDYRGYMMRSLNFYEKNSAGAYGGVQIIDSSLGTFEHVSAGRFKKKITTTYAGSNGAALSTLSTLTLASTTGWPTSGAGYVVATPGASGQKYHSFSYTGLSGSTLTGCIFNAPTTDTIATGAEITAAVGVGILINGNPRGGGEASNNTFTNCRTGTCAFGFMQLGVALTRLNDCFFDGNHNNVGSVTAGTTGVMVVSGTILATGGEIQAYDNLLHICKANQETYAHFRLEGWKASGVTLESDAGNDSCFIGGFGSSNISGKGPGLIINSGVHDAVISADLNALSPIVDNGTRTRFVNQSGLPLGGPSIPGVIVGRAPRYDLLNNLVGYEPIYDSIAGIAINRDLGGADPGTTGLTTATRTLTAPVNAGDWLCVAGGYGLASTVTVTITDSKSNTYTTQTHGDLNTGTTPHSFIATAPVTTALAVGDIITVTFSSAVNYPIFYAFDLIGVTSGGSYVDVSGSATGTSTAPSVSITTTTDYAYVIAVIEHTGTSTFTAGAGVTVLDSATSTGKTSDIVKFQAGAAGAQTIAGTLNTSGDWAVSAVAFKVGNLPAASTFVRDPGANGLVQRTGVNLASAIALDTDTALTANSDTRVATQKATKAYVDAHGGGGSVTNHNVYVGSGTSTPTAVAPGSSGTVLMSNGASSDPSFQAVTDSPAVAILSRQLFK